MGSLNILHVHCGGRGKGEAGRKGDTAVSLDMPAVQVICRQCPEDLSYDGCQSIRTTAPSVFESTLKILRKGKYAGQEAAELDS